MKKIRHPNIAMIIGICIDNDDYLYMVMEHYKNLNLNEYIQKKSGKIEILSKVSILFDIGKKFSFLV